MANLARILELAGITETLDSTDVRKTLRAEYWHQIIKNDKFDIWQHMDDPSIGQYRLNLDHAGNIETIDYMHPLSAIFNRHFTTIGGFIKHIAETTEENISDESFSNGAAYLRDIAKKSDDNLDESAPTRISASTTKDGVKTFRDYLKKQ